VEDWEGHTKTAELTWCKKPEGIAAMLVAAAIQVPAVGTVGTGQAVGVGDGGIVPKATDWRAARAGLPEARVMRREKKASKNIIALILTLALVETFVFV
jgi:hypothetical protein